jgi:ABC-type Fe3+-siderophore transport system permease subunit
MEEDLMSTARTPEPVSRSRVAIDAPRLWGGGLATAVVAAVGVLICRDLLDVKLVEPPLLRITNSFPVNYAITAFVLALAATGIAHLLSVVTPRPRVFFGWIIGLCTVAAMVVPFALDGNLKGQICAAVINMVIGICIASLLSAVLSRTVHDAERSWQQP